MTVLLAHLPGTTSETVFDAALEQATLRSAPLVVLNVATGEAPVEASTSSTDGLAQLVERARAAGVAASAEQPLHGDVAGAVLHAADEHAASVIVVGVRRRSPVGKLIMGSVSQQVILGADVPVLAVK